MKKIAAFESAIAKEIKDIREEGINPTVFWAYRTSINSGNDLIDFNEVIWEHDIEAINAIFAENNITEFTISSNFSGLIKTLVAFEKYGYKIAGITQINASHKDWITGEHAKADALLMQKA